MYLAQKLRQVLLVAFTLTLSAVLTFGQGIVTGTIAGTIQDPQGAVIAGANVTVVQTGTNVTQKTTTDKNGYFEIKNLQIGSYNVTVESQRFAKLEIKDLIVESGRVSSVGTRTLAVGGTSEVVSVEGGAPMIETTTSEIGLTFDSQVIQKLPNLNTGFDGLALYVPGVVNNGGTNFSNTNGAAIANNGLRGRSNNFQIDGQYNNDNSVAGPLVFLSNPDILSEVQVVTNNFGAEYGRNSGSVVNYLTKSGTNSFHGSAFDFNEGNWSFSLQNGQKNPLLGFCPAGTPAGTKTAFASSCTTPVVPRYVENRWGGTFGGPVLKDRLWFFASYQNDRVRQSGQGTSSTLTPTPDAIAQLAAAFPGNQAVAALQSFGPYGIKTGTVSPTGNIVSVPIQNPTTGATILSVPFQFVTRSVAEPFDDTQVTARGDWQITSKDRFFVRYVYQSSLNAIGSGTISSGAFVAVPAEDRDLGFDYTRTWSNTLVQQVRVGRTSGAFQFMGGSAFPTCVVTNYGACPPSIGFSDNVNSYQGFGPANNLPQDRQVHNTQYQSNLTYTLGRHTIKFGGELDHQNSPGHFLPNTNGTFTFSNYTLANKSVVNAYSAFLAGTGITAACPSGSTCSTLSLTDGPTVFPFKENDVSFYAQDDFRIRENLTLNLGLRWEWDQQAVNLLHDITVANVAAGFWSASAPTSVTVLPTIPEDFNNFGPNIGFAYTPHMFENIFGHDQTVFRGGYRIAYDPAFYNIFSNIASAAPVVNAGTVTNVGLPGTTGAAVQSADLSLIPRGANPATRNLTNVSPNFHNPYVQEWSFGIERQINSHVSVESRYVGNHSVGEFMTVDGNPLVSGIPSQYLPAGVTPCSAAGAAAGAGNNAVGRVNCNLGLVRTRNNGAWSKYDGLQNEIKLNNFHNLTANVSYTWSKGLDNTSEIFSSTGGVSNPAPQNPFNPNVGERGTTAQSYPQVFNVYWIYQMPWMKDQHGLLGKIVGGWEWSGTYRFQSGVPFTPTQNTSNGDPYCDGAWNNAFIGSTLDSCRPLLSNASAPLNTAGRYLNATQLINVSTCQSTAQVGTATCPVITPDTVHFIVNNTFAVNALCAGDPFACTQSRNAYRADSRSQSDMSIQKNFKAGEKWTIQVRADAFNIFNYQYLGVPGLNTNNKNINGVTTGGAPAPSTFMETWGNTGTNRAMVLSAHIYF